MDISRRALMKAASLLGGGIASTPNPAALIGAVTAGKAAVPLAEAALKQGKSLSTILPDNSETRSLISYILRDEIDQEIGSDDIDYSIIEKPVIRASIACFKSMSQTNKEREETNCRKRENMESRQKHRINRLARKIARAEYKKLSGDDDAVDFDDWL